MPTNIVVKTDTQTHVQPIRGGHTLTTVTTVTTSATTITVTRVMDSDEGDGQWLVRSNTHRHGTLACDVEEVDVESNKRRRVGDVSLIDLAGSLGRVTAT
jgi:hypothetical protein